MRTVITSALTTFGQALSRIRFRKISSGVLELGGLAALVVGVGQLAGDAWQWIAGGVAAVVYAIGLDRGAGE